jgi:hypothetical protein
MSLYLLPITINHRRTTLLALKPMEDEAQCYIVELDANATIPLISIQKAKLLQTFNINERDIPLDTVTFNTYQRENEIHIDLLVGKQTAPQPKVNSEEEIADWRGTSSKETSENKDQPKAANPKALVEFNLPQLSGTPIIADNTTIQYLLRTNGNEQFAHQIIENNDVLICLHLHINENVFHAKLKFAFATQASLLQIGFDFGSEASQIKVKRQREIGGLVNQELEDVHLFQEVKDFFDADGRSEEYYQYEKDTPFLKSAFFVKKLVQNEDKDLDTQLFLPQDSDINILQKLNAADRTFFESNMRLANLKISHKYDNQLTSFNIKSTTGKEGDRNRTHTLREIKTAIYGSILKQILSAYAINKLSKHKKYDLRATLLVPNIYEGFDLLLIRKAVYEIFTHINKTQLNGAIRNIELLTLSESDASFMGTFNTNNRFTQANSYYVIIDCGKGTTDFSIVQTEANAIEYKNLYRNGFAGAGNLITYAFFESFCTFLINNASNKLKAKEELHKVFNTLEGADKEKFYQHIERYKIKYRPERTELEIATSLNQITSGDINFENVMSTENSFSNLLELMAKVDSIYDWGDFISNAMLSIASDVVVNLDRVIASLTQDKIPCAGVLLSGRGFLFKPLQDLLKNAIINIGIPENLITVPASSNEFKTVCMQGVFKTGFIYNPDIVSMPVQARSKETPKAEIPKPPAEKATDFFGKFKSIFNLKKADSFFQGLLHEDGRFSEEGNTLRIMEKEFRKLRFIIGNSYYAPKSGQVENVQDLQLVFRGDKFILRSFNKASVLISTCELVPDSSTEQINTYNLYASMFPQLLDADQMKFSDTIINIKKDDYDDFMPANF